MADGILNEEDRPDDDGTYDEDDFFDEFEVDVEDATILLRSPGERDARDTWGLTDDHAQRLAADLFVAVAAIRCAQVLNDD